MSRRPAVVLVAFALSLISFAARANSASGGGETAASAVKSTADRAKATASLEPASSFDSKPSTGSGALATASLDDALDAAAAGDGVAAAAMLSKACPESALDARCLEAQTVFWARQGDREAASRAGLRLIELGSGPQAAGAASILARIGFGEEALEGMLARPDARKNRLVAEWASTFALSLGRWRASLDVAEGALRAVGPSWRLSVSAASAAGQLDQPAAARAYLTEAEKAGAPAQALQSAQRVAEAAEARASLAKGERSK